MTQTRRLFVLLAGGLLLFSQNGSSEESTITPKTSTITPAPFQNYWDANTWEKGSEENFWTQKKTVQTPKKAITKDSQVKTTVWSRTRTQSAK